MEKSNLGKGISDKSKFQDHRNLGEKERLFDLLIHDLSGPLSIVSTSTTNLLHKGDRYGPLTDSQKNVLERILRNTHKAQNLLHEMIEIFRSEEGYFQKELFAVEKMLKDSLIDVLELTTPTIGERLCHTGSQEEVKKILETQGIFIEMTGKYCTSHFCHDQNKIRQILRNLISNALKYRRSQTKVAISGEIDLLITVEDDGAGIPQDEQAMIYERFVRLDGEKRAQVPGLGLGLTGVKALVDAMMGEIQLVSHQGVGTCFTVRIPPLH